jgi:hypothetical protein
MGRRARWLLDQAAAEGGTTQPASSGRLPRSRLTAATAHGPLLVVAISVTIPGRTHAILAETEAAGANPIMPTVDRLPTHGVVGPVAAREL